MKETHSDAFFDRMRDIMRKEARRRKRKKITYTIGAGVMSLGVVFGGLRYHKEIGKVFSQGTGVDKEQEAVMMRLHIPADHPELLAKVIIYDDKGFISDPEYNELVQNHTPLTQKKLDKIVLCHPRTQREFEDLLTEKHPKSSAFDSLLKGKLEFKEDGVMVLEPMGARITIDHDGGIHKSAYDTTNGYRVPAKHLFPGSDYWVDDEVR